MTARTAGPVLIVGSGLLGASIGHALRALDVDVALEDSSPSTLDLAIDYGAGRRAESDEKPALVVVAVPPDQLAAVIGAALVRFPDALVTDVGSVKVSPLAELVENGAPIERYLGSHPLAGRERGGAISARADIFLGRPWVITPHAQTTSAQIHAIEALVLDVGAAPVQLSPEEHDHSVALISHVPQLVASLMAARLVDAPSAAVAIAGQGVRDVTRVAASSPELWVQILTANAAQVGPVLSAIRDDLATLEAAIVAHGAPGARRTIAELLRSGNTGVARLPGKHGGDARFAQLVVLIDDRPGQIAKLLTEVGELGVNLEDLRLEHSPGAQIGIVELSIVPEARDRLEEELTTRGWRIAG
ncbi:prephenate dehydrogenase [Naasia lichenicola]|uniref:Prephenate dehydrogenase n=1 Tax=Naasia lichenicola TaxID=2565933 RepID=A0A4S4FS77_9MICO|nr:prephenate dehydrogenase [Naasia lichenicola]THG33549.1 prephenate dehydrogenase [Naasia lichenicola]